MMSALSGTIFRWDGKTGIRILWIIDPENGLLFLEVKDWTVSTLRQANQEQVTLETDGLLKSEINPLVQVRRYACDTVNALPADPCLRQNDGRLRDG